MYEYKQVNTLEKVNLLAKEGWEVYWITKFFSYGSDYHMRRKVSIYADHTVTIVGVDARVEGAFPKFDS